MRLDDNIPVQSVANVGGALLDQWAEGEALSAFLTPVVGLSRISFLDPDRATDPSTRTEVFLGYDRRTVYVHFVCHEPCMDSLQTQNTSPERKPLIPPVMFHDDYVEVFLDPTWNLTDAVHLLVNPAGTLYSSQHRVSAFEMVGKSSWRPPHTDISTRRNPESWEVLLAISVDDLGIAEIDDGHVMGLNLIRYRPQTQEKTQLVPQTVAWTTQWTNEVIHEAYKFSPIVLGGKADAEALNAELRDKRLAHLSATPGHRHESASTPRDWPFKLVKTIDADKHALKPINGQTFWLMAPDFGKFKGLEDTVFRKIAPLQAHHRNLGGTYKYGQSGITDGRILKVALREVALVDADGVDRADRARIVTHPKGIDVEQLRDGRDDTCCIFTENRVLPSQARFEFHFSEPVPLTQVRLKHGEPFGLEINGHVVPYKNIASHFVVACRHDGVWETLPAGEVDDNFAPETTLDLDNVVTDAVRIDILAQTYSGLDYKGDDVRRWLFEDWNEQGRPCQVNADLEEVLFETPGMQTLDERPFTFEYLKFMDADSVFTTENEPLVGAVFDALARGNPEGFLGAFSHEWDSGLLSLSIFKDWRNTRFTSKEFLNNLPPFTTDKIATRDKWAELLRLHVARTHGHLLLENSWRLGDHFAMLCGNKMPMVENSPNGQPSMQTQIAFTRGAARQFQKPWGSYQALCFDQGATNYFAGHSGARSKRKGSGEDEWSFNDFTGPSAELHGRMLFYAYFTGAAIMELEAVPEGYVIPDAGFGRYRISPHGEKLAELLEYQSHFPDRPVPYSPIGVVMNYDHGYAYPYQTCYAYGRSGEQTWVATPYTDGDRMTNAFFNEVYPVALQRIERDNFFLSNSIYGDMFDVVVANMASDREDADIFASYPVLLLLGDIEKTSDLTRRLQSYVEQGGILVANQMHQAIVDDLALPSLAPMHGFPSFKSAAAGQGRVIVNQTPCMLDPNGLMDEESKQFLYSLTEHVAPFRVRGDVGRVFAKSATGWQCMLFNNKGIFKFSDQASDVDTSKAADVTLSFCETPSAIAIWSQGRADDIAPADQLDLTIIPGEFVIVHVE